MRALTPRRARSWLPSGLLIPSWSGADAGSPRVRPGIRARGRDLRAARARLSLQSPPGYRPPAPPPCGWVLGLRHGRGAVAKPAALALARGHAVADVRGRDGRRRAAAAPAPGGLRRGPRPRPGAAAGRLPQPLPRRG